MSQNKGKEHADYFDPRALENYCRNDILFTFKLAVRNAGRRIAKGELKDDKETTASNAALCTPSTKDNI